MMRIGTAQPVSQRIDWRLEKPDEVLARVDSVLGALTELIDRAGKSGCDILTLPEDTLNTLHWEAAHLESLGEVLPAAVERMLVRLGEAAAAHQMYLVC